MGKDTGQSFIAPVSTQLNAIAVKSRYNQTTHLNIYDSAGNLLLHQLIDLTASTASDPLQIINLDNLVNVTGGQTYAFIIEGNPYLFADNTAPYADGSVVTDYMTSTDATFSLGNDLAFAIYNYQAPPPPVAEPKAIPATSLSAVIVLLSTVFAFALYRRTKQ